MASGDTLATFTPQMNEPPAANYATLDTRNSHPVLEFDGSTLVESAIFSSTMPNNYGAGTNINVVICWAADTATSGNMIWNVSLERISTSQDLDSDGFAAAVASAPTAAPTGGTNPGLPLYTTITLSGGSLDSIAIGEMFRLKINRDPTTTEDTMAGDAQLRGVEMKQA